MLDANSKCDTLKYDEIDSKLARFYFNANRQDNSSSIKIFKKEFEDLRESIEISVKWNGSKFDRKITSNETAIEKIRDRFTRLDDLNHIEISRNQPRLEQM